MDIQRRAGMILQAWELADWSAFRSAIRCAAEPLPQHERICSLESERQELLISAVAGLAAVERRDVPSASSVEAALFLIKHLAGSSTANRLFLVKKNA